MADFVNELENEATEYIKELREYRTQPGDDSARLRRAKVALGVIGSYVRFRATLANERTNDLVEKRLELSAPAAPAPKQLTE